MSKWIEGSVLANGINIHYTRTGGEKPPLVLAHGFSDHGMCWIRIAQALEATYDLIMLDARGHGASERIHEPFSTDILADDLLGAMDALSLDRPGVFGHSMGASTASVAAAIAPEKVGYLILEDPPWFNSFAERQGGPRNSDFENHIIDLQSRPYDEALAIATRNNPAGWHADETRTWLDSKLQLDLRIFHDIREATRFLDWHEVVPQIQCPTLLLTAETGIVTAEVGQAVAETSKWVKWVQIPNAGHCVHRDDFEASMVAVRAFLVEQIKP